MTTEEVIKSLFQGEPGVDDRKYGFKHIQKEYRWMSPGWIDKLIQEESNQDVSDYVSWMLQDLTTPEKSRLESSTESFDSIEGYVCNRLVANRIAFKDDKVYYWLLKSIDFFAQHDAFEFCYNIQRAIEIIKEKESAIKNAPIELGEDGLPF